MPPVLPNQNGVCCSNIPCPDENPGPPGIQGDPGAAGADGSNGLNAYTTLTSSFVQPAVSGNVTVNVVNGLWASVGQHVYVSQGGDYIVNSRASTQLSLQNTGADGNVAPTTLIASANTVSPSGVTGPSGTLSGAAGGDLTGTYPNPTLVTTGIVPGASTKPTFDAKGRAVSLGSLIASDIPAISAATQLTGVLPIANGGTGAATAILGFNALSPLTTKGDSLTNNGTDDVRIGVGSAGQSLLAQPLLTNGLGYRNGYILLGSASVNANTTSDTAIPILGSTYIVRRIIAFGASISLTTVTSGIYTAASKGGSALVASSQAYSALTTATKFLDLTLQAPATTDYQTSANLYFSPTIAQGSAATLTIQIWGELVG